MNFYIIIERQFHHLSTWKSKLISSRDLEGQGEPDVLQSPTLGKNATSPVSMLPAPDRGLLWCSSGTVGMITTKNGRVVVAVYGHSPHA